MCTCEVVGASLKEKKKRSSTLAKTPLSVSEDAPRSLLVHCTQNWWFEEPPLHAQQVRKVVAVLRVLKVFGHFRTRSLLIIKVCNCDRFKLNAPVGRPTCLRSDQAAQFRHAHEDVSESLNHFVLHVIISSNCSCGNGRARSSGGLAGCLGTRATQPALLLATNPAHRAVHHFRLILSNEPQHLPILLRIEEAGTGGDARVLLRSNSTSWHPLLLSTRCTLPLK